MKKFKYIVAALVIGFALTGCEDEDKQRFPQLGNGGFIKFVTQPDFWDGITAIDIDADGANDFAVTRYSIGADPAEASFTAFVEDPNQNIASLKMWVRGELDDVLTEAVMFKETTTFPLDVSFNTADISALLGVDAADWQENDSFVFFTEITTNDGRIYNSLVTSCDECPDTIFDEETGERLDSGTWNGGTIDGVILQGGDTGENFILPANVYTIRYRDI